MDEGVGMDEGQQEQQQQAQEDRQRQQGVLWKRRDVFKNKWRPRWFVLQPEEAVLSYYLLSRADAAATSTISTPLRRNNNNNNPSTNATSTTSNATGAGTWLPEPATASVPNPSVHSAVSDLSTDHTITVSENPIDYDVVPRGAIYLAGCQVAANDNLSRPQEGLFAFSIVPPNSDETECHLAARTEEARAAWVATLSAACRNASAGEDARSNGETNNEGAAAYNSQNGSSSSSCQSSWKSLSPPETLFDNVPEPLAAKLEQSLESHLELCEDVAPALHWTPIFQDRDGVSAYQRQDLHGRVTMKSTAVIPHHPKQLLNLLLDSSRRKNFETNIAVSERLEVLNQFVMLDYYAFKAVWPTSPRDFAVVLHWQTLQRQLIGTANGPKEEALVLLAFSCPEADNIREPSAPHVRANLHASFYLLKLIPPTAEATEESSSCSAPKCELTRILSYSLGGSLPRNLATTVMMQQAGLPGILSKHLKHVEPTPEPRLYTTTTEDGSMSNESVIADVVQHIIQQDNTAFVSNARRRLNFDDSEQERRASDAESSLPAEPAGPREFTLPFIAAILVLPVLLHRLAIAVSSSVIMGAFHVWFLRPATVFCVSAFFAVRLVLLQTLGQEVPNTSFLREHEGGPVTCQLSVDLKGVLRFIGMKKEEDKELSTTDQAHTKGQHEVSIVHIVAMALARAMRNNADCWNCRRVSFPYLLVDGCYRYPASGLDISISLASGRLVTLRDFNYDKVQAVANAYLLADQGGQEGNTTQHPAQVKGMGLLKDILSVMSLSLFDNRQRQGRCLIVLTKTDTDEDNQTSNSSDPGGVKITVGSLPDDLDAMLVVGGVRLQRNVSSVGSPVRAPKPVLALSLTINTTSLLDASKCERLAEDLQKFIQFPELCDG